MLRSFVISTARFSMFWLCPDVITARFDDYWQNLHCYEGKFKKAKVKALSQAFTDHPQTAGVFSWREGRCEVSVSVSTRKVMIHLGLCQLISALWKRWNQKSLSDWISEWKYHLHWLSCPGQIKMCTSLMFCWQGTRRSLLATVLLSKDLVNSLSTRKLDSQVWLNIKKIS